VINHQANFISEENQLVITAQEEEKTIQPLRDAINNLNLLRNGPSNTVSVSASVAEGSKSGH
jgi:uncharacterized protein YbaP (TraB family)